MRSILESFLSVMGDPETFLVLFLPSSILIAIYATFRLAPGLSKSLFLLFLAAIGVYGSAIGIVKSDLISHEDAEFVSRVGFVSIQLVILAGIVFSIFFTEQPKVFRSWHFALFFFGWAIIFLLVLLGFVENGILIREGGERAPNYGIAHVYMVRFNMAAGLYFIFLMIRSYKYSYSRVLKFQIKYLAKTVVISVVCVTIFNGILPEYGNSRYSIYGVFSFFVIFYGILNLLLNEKTLMVHTAIEFLLKKLKSLSARNLDELRRLVWELETFVERNPDRLSLRLRFVTETGVSSINLVRGGRQEVAGDLDERFEIQALRKIPGLVETIKRLEKQNLFLGLATSRFEQNLHEALSQNRLTPELLQELTAGTDDLKDLIASQAPDDESLSVDKIKAFFESVLSEAARPSDARGSVPLYEVSIEKVVDENCLGAALKFEPVANYSRALLSYIDGSLTITDEDNDILFTAEETSLPTINNDVLEFFLFKTAGEPGSYSRCRVTAKFYNGEEEESPAAG